MSHFTVLVVGDDVEGQLAPYQENNMGDCPKEYLEFNDVEPEIREEWETDTVTRVKMPDGRLLTTYDEEFRISGQIGIGNSTHKVPEDLEKVEVPLKELYPDFGQFAEEYHGYRKDEITGKYGYWENPNRKWDWYQVGGRWTGFFPLKPGATGEIGAPGLMTSPAEVGYADQARLCDIDLDRARDEAEREARHRFAVWRRAFEATERAESWDDIRDRVCGTGDDFNRDKVDEARKLYARQPAIRKLDELDKRNFFFVDAPSELGYDEEAYVQKCRDRALTTFAILKDGEWYEKSSMGWFGISYDEKMTQEEWNHNFAKLLDELPSDTLLTVVDCHI